MCTPAQATVLISALPKSNAAGQAYWAAMNDVLEHGSLPVPNHLRNAGDRRMKEHGIGVHYRYPHDFEGHDVDQQYLPDKLHELGRRYYYPTDQGQEASIAERMARREAIRRAGPPKRRQIVGPKVDAMRVAGQVTRARDGARTSLAETETRDARS